MGVVIRIKCQGCGAENVISAFPHVYAHICVECAQIQVEYQRECLRRAKETVAALDGRV